MKLSEVEEVARQEESRQEAMRYGVHTEFRTDCIEACNGNPRSVQCGAGRGHILTRWERVST